MKIRNIIIGAIVAIVITSNINNAAAGGFLGIGGGSKSATAVTNTPTPATFSAIQLTNTTPATTVTPSNAPNSVITMPSGVAATAKKVVYYDLSKTNIQGVVGGELWLVDNQSENTLSVWVKQGKRTIGYDLDAGDNQKMSSSVGEITVWWTVKDGNKVRGKVDFAIDNETEVTKNGMTYRTILKITDIEKD